MFGHSQEDRSPLRDFYAAASNRTGYEDMFDYRDLVTRLEKPAYLAKWNLKSDFYEDTILNPTWADVDTVFWGAARRQHLNPRTSEMAEIAVEIMMGERDPESLYSSYSTTHSRFGTPDSANSSLLESDYLSSVFSRSSSRTSYTSMNSEKDAEIRDLWELGRLKEERQKLLNPLQRRITASKIDGSCDKGSSIADALQGEGDDEIPEVAVRAAHVPSYKQKFRQLKNILSPAYVPEPIDMNKINAAMEESKKWGVTYEIIVDEEPEEELGQLMYPEEDDELINIAELDWAEDGDTINSTNVKAEEQGTMRGGYNIVPESVSSGTTYFGGREPSYSRALTLGYL